MIYCVLNNNTFKLFWREHTIKVFIIKVTISFEKYELCAASKSKTVMMSRTSESLAHYVKMMTEI